MSPNEHPSGQRPDAQPEHEQVSAGPWPERLQQQWDAVLASLGHERGGEELRATMQLFLQSQQLIAASLSSYFAALSGHATTSPAIEGRLSELERRMAALEDELATRGRPAAPPARSLRPQGGGSAAPADDAPSGAA